MVVCIVVRKVSSSRTITNRLVLGQVTENPSGGSGSGLRTKKISVANRSSYC